MIDDREPGRALWIVTAEQLGKGYMRRHADGRVTGPHPYVVLGKLEDGSFEVELPPDDAEEPA